jgi:multiple sugar transport system permease protein
MAFPAIKDKHVKYVFLLPAVLWMFGFTVYPLLYSFYMSFQKVKLVGPDVFIGLKNYTRIFGDYYVGNSAKLTTVMVLTTVGLQVAIGLLLALIMNAEIAGRRYFRTLFSLPIFVAPVAIGYLGHTIFYEQGGPLNILLTSIGLKAIPWLSHPTWAFVAICMIEVWIATPFCFMVLLAGLQGLPEEVYEAARLDYKSEWQIFLRITLPLLAPVILIVFLLRLVSALRILDTVYALTAGGPGTATEVYSLITYRAAMKFFDFGYGAALAYVLLMVVMIILMFFFRRMREIYE